jgi:16S rRNA (cytosine1402-N4)-methyltransferase
VANEFAHAPVLLEESLEWLALGPKSIVVDGTVGGGGHAEAILERSAPDGRLIGLDRDREALAAAGRRLASFGGRASLVHSSFRGMHEVLARLDIDYVDGVLLDLGISSHQLDTPGRGFRFGSDTAEHTPLDMRMDPDSDVTAAILLRTASTEELEDWLRRYADLRGARRLARALVAAREHAPLETASDLVRVIREARIGGGRRHDPATLVFQALRIATNEELDALTEGLAAAIDVLRPGGRLVVIAYHSAEDRIVKHGMREAARSCVCPPEVPICVCDHQPKLRVLTRRPITPSPEELGANPRARSAKLRAAERVAEAA